MRFSENPPLIKLFLQPPPLGGGIAFELCRCVGEFAAELFFQFFGDLLSCRFPRLGDCASQLRLGLGSGGGLRVMDCGLKMFLKFLLERLARFRNNTVEFSRKRR